MPVQPGPLTLLYPKWLPGNHSPTGQIEKVAGLVIKPDEHISLFANRIRLDRVEAEDLVLGV